MILCLVAAMELLLHGVFVCAFLIVVIFIYFHHYDNMKIKRNYMLFYVAYMSIESMDCERSESFSLKRYT